MSRDNQNEINDNNLKEPKIEKEKNNSSFTQSNDKDGNDCRINQNLINLQNSEHKNLKNDVKSESAIFFFFLMNIIFFDRNTTPRKLFHNEYFNSIISPFKEFPFKPFNDSPFKRTYNMASPENNFRFTSSINSKLILNFFYFL